MDPHTRISRPLIAWYLRHSRDLPWRRTRDPYRIWVSEIMLQQTRVETVIPYYQRFLERFPTAEALAAASAEEVLTAWSGLGYYSRARNLHRAARQVGDGFPRDYEGIRALAGIGPYTAAAIASIAFDLPHAVLDGNVLRVVARVQNDPADIAAPRTRERFRAIAQAWLDTRRPGLFNQALMELGATVCLPRTPLCGRCPLAATCEAHARGTAAELPVKLRKAAAQRIDAVVALVESRGRILLWRRDGAARRMAGFWELPAPDQLPGFRKSAVVGEFRHTITHHHYRFTVVSGTLDRAPRGMRWFRPLEFSTIPLSTTARKALHVRKM